MPRYIGTLNVTHRDIVTTGETTPPSPLNLSANSNSPNAKSPLIPPVVNAPARTITPLPEVQIDKNRHVIPLSPFNTPYCLLMVIFSMLHTSVLIACVDHPEMVTRTENKYINASFPHTSSGPTTYRTQKNNRRRNNNKL